MSQIHITQDDGEISCCESDEEYTKTAKTINLNDQGANTNNNMSSGVNNDIKNSYENDMNNQGQSSTSNETLLSTSTPMSLYNEERMKRKLQFFFMNPIEKWQARRQFPYKFVLQVSTDSQIILFCLIRK